jgi:malate/lactate dehydrogenase
MKIGIVGAGQVGATAAYSMMMRGVGSEITLVDRKVTSRVMCQLEKGWDSLHFVFVGEDGEEDAVH